MKTHSSFGFTLQMLAPFSEWFSQITPEDHEQYASFECAECDGAGTSACGCCDSEVECPCCDGFGYIRRTDSQVRDELRTRYFKECVADIKRLCLWKGYDYLGEVGQFVQAYRQHRI